MRNIIRKSFKRKLLVCFFAVALLPLLISYLFLTRIFQKRVIQEYEQKNQEQAASASGMFTDLFADMEQVMAELASSRELTSSCWQDEDTGYHAAYAQLYEAAGKLEDAVQFDLYTAEGICRFSTGYGESQSNLPVYWGILKIATAHPDSMILRGEKGHEGNGNVCLRAAKAILDQKDECTGYVVAEMREANLEQILNGYYGSQDGICILNRFWEPIYSTGTANQEHIGEVLRNRLLNGIPLLHSYNGHRVYLSPIGETGLFCVLMRPEVVTKEIQDASYHVLLLIIFFTLFLSLIAAVCLSANLSRPLIRMNEVMERMCRGELDIRLPVDREDELGQLSSSFNSMSAELKQYMENQVRQQTQLNETRIAMMQAQLNPHFLYNTLDTMKWVAKANHIPDLATLASKLAKILRASISSEPFITLKQELELADSYAQIQKVRFQGKFTFVFSLPAELERCMVPKLIVQPIVENAVIHGLAECEKGTIFVKAGTGEGCLIIDVEDDGCGISQEMIEQLNTGKMKGHLGIYNVNTILQLYFGDAYGLTIDRLEPKGTRVTIRIPLENECTTEKEGEENESVDSR